MQAVMILHFISFWPMLTQLICSAIAGTMKVVASNHVKKHQMNKDGNRGSITIARCGISAGADGPRYLLVKAEKIEHKSFHNFDKNHKAHPAGSKVIASPNAYMHQRPL